jgi:hypothetical protein
MVKTLNLAVRLGCCAHLLRELIAAAEIEQAKTWAQQAINALVALKQAADVAVAAGAAGIDPAGLAEREPVGYLRPSELNERI